MAFTWCEIQVVSVKKMFLNNTTITVDDLPFMKLDRKYQTYLDAMPLTTNEALLRLMAVSRPLIKQYTLTYNMPDDIYDALSFDTHAIVDEDYVVECEGAHSYYFELDNTATVTIESYDTSTGLWTTISTITHSTTTTTVQKYEVKKGLIVNTTNKLIRMTFVHNHYLYNVRNIALYTSNFRTAAEVFNCTPKQKYNLKTLITDFYKVSSVEYESTTNSKGTYNSDYVIQGDNTMEIDSKLKGNFIIRYEAYPDKIVDTTVDTYVFTLADEMVVLLPLYIASELYKDVDTSIATQYRNQFELGLQEVLTVDEPQEFSSNSNWF